jgi:hypothetical protein
VHYETLHFESMFDSGLEIENLHYIIIKLISSPRRR